MANAMTTFLSPSLLRISAFIHYLQLRHLPIDKSLNTQYNLFVLLNMITRRKTLRLFLGSIYSQN